MRTKVTYLTAPKGFSLKATVLSHGWHECSPMTWSEGGRCFQLIDREGEQPFRISVTLDGSADRGNDRLRVLIETTGRDTAAQIEECEPALLRRLSLTLGLDRDLSEFYALCSRHPMLRSAPSIGAGRIIRSAGMTENVLKAICGTNVNWTQAVKMINRLGQLGPSIPHFRSQNAWPTPREILRAGEKYLVEVCRLGYRTPSILRFCREVAEGKFDPDSLDATASDPDVSSEELVRVFRTIPGIGPSSANYLIGFLGRHDRLAIDTSTVAHVRAMHMGGRKPTFKQIEKLYAPYGKWKNLVCWLENWLTWGTAKEIIAEAKPVRQKPRARR